MTQFRLISADSHVNEPPDLWATRVDKKYRDRAPRLATDIPGKEGAYFLYEGYAPHPIGIGFGAGLRHHFAVQRDEPARDHLLSVAARGNAGGGDDFL